jgi:uncharacterized protein
MIRSAPQLASQGEERPIVKDLLTDVEVRVLGSLIEKEMTTPDNYPLSLNALTAACNQSSNRDPVVQYDDDTVIRAVETLRKRSLVRAVQRHDSRVMKYRQLASETMNLDPRETALLAVLMLRGAQTVGELRTRTARMSEFESLTHVEDVLSALSSRATPLVSRLPRRPGQKEVRYAHQLAGEVSADTIETPQRRAGSDADRIAALEEAANELRTQVADLRSELETFRKQFE